MAHLFCDIVKRAAVLLDFSGIELFVLYFLLGIPRSNHLDLISPKEATEQVALHESSKLLESLDTLCFYGKPRRQRVVLTCLLDCLDIKSTATPIPIYLLARNSERRLLKCRPLVDFVGLQSFGDPS